MSGRAVFTVGHSTREADELVGLLQGNAIDLVIDVRRYPGSRRHPQFSREALMQRLDAAGIAYRHAPELGGRREPAPDSVNTGLRNAGFRAYADHMGTPEFLAALDRAIAEADHQTVAIMCAEAVPWRCHRNLISDALVARGRDVRHILTAAETRAHVLDARAKVAVDGRVTYPRPSTGESQRELFDPTVPGRDSS